MKLAIIGCENEYNGVGCNRIHHLMKSMPKNLDIEYHVMGKSNSRLNGSSYNYHIPMSSIKLLKRYKLRQAFLKELKGNLDADIILMSSPPTILGEILKHFSPTIFDVRDIWQEWVHHSWIKRQIEKSEQRKAMKFANLVTYAHAGFQKYLEKDLRNGQSNKLKFISNGANSEIFYPQEKKTPDLFPSDTINLLYAGTLADYHDASIWIQLMRNLGEEFHLTFIGAGSAKLHIQADTWLSTGKDGIPLKYRTEFLDSVDQRTLADYINNADYCLASFSKKNPVIFNNSVPTKIFESLLCGTPTIAYCGQAVQSMNNLGLFASSSLKEIYNYLKKPKSQVNKQQISQEAQRYNFQSIGLGFYQLLEEIYEKHN
jgi:glycosyltransferase involved in cell wall biosynthesis